MKLEFISNLNLIKKLLVNNQRSKLRSAMRGYFFLKKIDKLDELEIIREKISNYKFSETSGKFSKTLMGGSFLYILSYLQDNTFLQDYLI